MLKRLLKLYAYLKLGIGNYLSFSLALFNTASLVWYFTGLKNKMNFLSFLLAFFAVYFPIAGILGYYDLKRLVAKTMSEVSPYWKRPTFFMTHYLLGTVVYLPEALIFWELTKDERVRECSIKAFKNYLRLLLSEGEERPKDPCFCKLALEEDLIDQKHYEMCKEVEEKLE